MIDMWKLPVDVDIKFKDKWFGFDNINDEFKFAQQVFDKYISILTNHIDSLEEDVEDVEVPRK